MIWYPSAGPKDSAGNALTIANATENGPADVDF
jgi:hypothetical protein